MKGNKMKAWWFSGGYELPHGDGRAVELGITHKVDGKIIPGRNGLLASRRAIDALANATGPIVWRVQLGGDIVHGVGQHAASERTYIAGGIDVSDILRRFARKCALDVAHLWDAPEIVIRFLKTGDESIREAAWDAACAASDAACAASDAARAAREAAWVSWAAARAASAAAWVSLAAAWAASDASREKQNRRLTAMLAAAMRSQPAESTGGDTIRMAQ